MKRRYGFLAGIILCMALPLPGASVAGEELSGELVITADGDRDAYDCIATHLWRNIRMFLFGLTDPRRKKCLPMNSFKE